MKPIGGEKHIISKKKKKKKKVVKFFCWNVIFHSVQRKRSSGILQY